MKVTLGKEGLENSIYQQYFPEIHKCCYCDGEAWMAFVANEGGPYEEDIVYQKDVIQCVCNLYKNEGEGKYWAHDCIAVAIYLCRSCGEATALTDHCGG